MIHKSKTQPPAKDDPDVEKPMRAIFAALQELLEAAAPSMRRNSPQQYASAMEMVATGRASFGAKVETSPSQVTLTLTHADGVLEIVSFLFPEPLQ